MVNRATASSFVKAEKKNLKLRLALSGIAGSGKTFTALNVAQYLGENIAVIDTENGSSAHYADIFDFSICKLDNHHPALYIEKISEAEEAGFDVIVIDSLTHAWLTELEIVGGIFQNWNKVRPIERKLVQKLIGSRCHIIATMRAKTEWVTEEYTGKDGKTKSAPKRVGTESIQAKGIEFEFDATGDLDSEHMLTITKTRFPILNKETFLNPGKQFAKALLEALSSKKGKEGYSNISDFGHEEEQVIIAPTKVVQMPSTNNKPAKPSIDRDKYMQLTNVELKRLGWTAEIGRDYLERNYKQRSRQTLSDQDLVNFYNQLKAMPTSAEKLTQKDKEFLNKVVGLFNLPSNSIDEILLKFPNVEINKEGVISILEQLAIKFANDYILVTDNEIFDNPEKNVCMTPLQVAESLDQMTSKDPFSLELIGQWADYIKNIDMQEETSQQDTEQSHPFDSPDYIYEVCAIFNLNPDTLDDEVEKYTDQLTHQDIADICLWMAEEFAKTECSLTIERVKDSWFKRVVAKDYALEAIGDWKEFILEADQLDEVDPEKQHVREAETVQ